MLKINTKKTLIILTTFSIVFTIANASKTEIYADSVTTDIAVDDANDTTFEEEQLIEEEDVMPEIVETIEEDPFQDVDIVEVQEIESIHNENTIAESLSPRAKTIEVRNFNELKKEIESKTFKDSGDVYRIYGNSFTSTSSINIPQGYSFTLRGVNSQSLLNNTYINSGHSYFTYNYTTPIKIVVENIRLSETRNVGMFYSNKTTNNLEIVFNNVTMTQVRRLVNAPGATVIMMNNTSYTFNPTLTNGIFSIFRAHTVEFRDSATINVQGSNLPHSLFELNSLKVVSGTLSINSSGPIYKGLSSISQSEITINPSATLSINEGNTSIENSLDFMAIEVGTLSVEGRLILVSIGGKENVLNAQNIIGNGFMKIMVLSSTVPVQTNTIINVGKLELANLEIRGDSPVNRVINVTESMSIRNSLLIVVTSVENDVIGTNKQDNMVPIDLTGQVKIEVLEIDHTIINIDYLDIHEALLIINVGEYSSEPLIHTNQAMKLNNLKENSKIVVNDSRAHQSEAIFKSLNTLEVQNSFLNIDNETGDFKAIFDAENFDFLSDVDNNRVLRVKDHSKHPVLIKTNHGKIRSNQVNQWELDVVINEYPSDHQMPTKRYYQDSSTLLEIQFTSNGNETQVLNPIETTYDTTASFSVTGNTITSMGNIIVELEDNEKNDATIIKGKTEAHTHGKLMLRKPIYFVSDENGNINTQLDQPIINGTHTASVFSNYTFGENKVTYLNAGEFKISEFPSSLNFGNITLNENKKVYPRQEENEIVIYDGRLERTGWTLSVSIEEELNIPTVPNSSISNAFVYNDASQRLSKEPLVVYETSGNDYEPETVISWKKDEGLLLFIENMYDLRMNNPYQSKLIWTLESK